MNPLNILNKLVTPVTDIIKEVVPDKDLAKNLQHDIQKTLLENVTELLEAQRSIIIAEIQSENWLAQSWRPIVMLVLAGCVLAHWLGFTPENLTSDETSDLFDVVKIGLGGYVVGRSAEKVTKALQQRN